MKTLILIICVTATITCYSQCDTTGNLSGKDSLVLSFIKNLNSESFKGELIGDVLKKDIIKDYCEYSYIQKVVGVFSGIDLSYNGFIVLRLIVSPNQCTGFGRISSKWDFEKIKKCKVSQVKVLDFRDVL